MNITDSDIGQLRDTQQWVKEHHMSEQLWITAPEGERYSYPVGSEWVNVPTPAEALAAELRDIAHRVNYVRWTATLDGPEQAELDTAWTALGELANALMGLPAR